MKKIVDRSNITSNADGLFFLKEENFSHKMFFHGMALVTFLGLSCFFFSPILFDPHSILFGGSGDCQATVAGIWATINGYVKGPSIPLYSAPFGIPSVNGGIQPLFEWITVVFAHLGGEISGYNFLIILSFPLTALTTYFFLFYYLRDPFSAFVGGTAFGFCSGAILHASAGHLTYSINFMLPLFLWALLYHHLKHHFLSSLLVGATYSILTLLSIYWGYFALFLGLYLAVFDLICHRKKIVTTSMSYLPGVLLAGVAIGYFLFPHICSQLTSDSDTLAKSGRVRSLVELATLSARPWDYVLPPVTHPFWGKWTNPLALRLVHGSNVIEQTLYLGVVPICLLFVGVWMAKNNVFSKDRNRLFLLFVGGALTMLILSAPPYIPIGANRIPLLSYFLHPIFPMFRAYARSGIFVCLFLSCSAAVVLTQLRSNGMLLQKKVVLFLITVLLIFDGWCVSPDLFTKVSTPEVYEWLKNQPGDFIIAAYPMSPYNEASYYQYPFWQRVHRKRMVNGALPQCKEAWQMFNDVQDLSRQQTVEILRKHGVKYVIVHPLLYEEGPIPLPIKRFYPAHFSEAKYGPCPSPENSFLGQPYRVFGRDRIYRLS